MGHDELDILGLKIGVVDLLLVIIFFLGLLVLDRLAPGVLLGVVMARMVGTGLFGGSELLCGGGLVLRVEIFNLGFTEDAEMMSVD